MKPTDEYHLEGEEFDELKTFILEQGTHRELKKRELLVRQGEPSPYVGYIVSGMLRHTCIDSSGRSHITGYSLEHDFVGEYSANLCGRGSLVNIEAVTACRVVMVHYALVEAWWHSSAACQQVGRTLAEALFVLTYRSLIESACCTPAERYRNVMRRYPNLKELVPLKEIASFIGVTPETVSAIRRQISKNS